MPKHIQTLALSMLISCGRPGTSSPSAVELPTRPYAGLVASVQDSDGFVDTAHCDSTLFSGLLGAAGVSVNLQAAEVEPGRWLRRPATYPECYAAGESRSTVSRDQLLGVLWWAWRTHNSGALDRLWAYGASHKWVMGKPAEHAVMNPAMIGLLARARHALGSYTPLWARALPVSPADGATDFEAHLGALQLGLLREVTGDLSAKQYEWLQAQALRQPSNPLFPAVLGDRAKAAELLSNEAVWPTDRLPTSADRCEPWVTQRDLGADWAPCDETNTHSGGDWLFVASLLGA